MKRSLIAAVARNGVIGRGEADGGGIPWELPRDTEHFRRFTAGKWLLLGRKTFSEMEGWFSEEQIPVVLTRQQDFSVENGFAVHSVEEAIALARKKEVAELVVCGGASVYESALPFVEEMVLTRVEAETDGEAFFPDWNRDEWILKDEKHWPADAENEHAMRLQTWERIRGGAGLEN